MPIYCYYTFSGVISLLLYSLYHFLHFFLLHHSHLCCRLALHRYEEEGGDALAAEDGGKFWFLVDVNLVEIYLACILFGQLLYDR